MIAGHPLRAPEGDRLRSDRGGRQPSAGFLDGPALHFDTAAWTVFTTSIKAGHFGA